MLAGNDPPPHGVRGEPAATLDFYSNLAGEGYSLSSLVGVSGGLLKSLVFPDCSVGTRPFLNTVSGDHLNNQNSYLHNKIPMPQVSAEMGIKSPGFFFHW